MIKRILLWIVAIVVVLVIGAYTYYKYVIYEAPLISRKDRAELQIMPLPSKLEFGEENLRLEGALKINHEKINNDRITNAIQRFEKHIQKIVLRNNGTSKEEISLSVKLIKDESSIPQFPSINPEESYILEISDEGIRIDALTDLGVVYGLETVKQLIANDAAGHYLQHVKISDNPRFSWRGLMIDVARHWIPKEVILRNLNAMVAVKMNVLHLHLSDDQGFRVESKLFPKLHELGSNGNFFSQKDINEIVAHADNLGIRIIPEFDMPGHTQSWLIGYPEFASKKGPISFRMDDGELFSVPMDPTNESLYSFIDEFIGEMTTLFPDPYFHIGGDEVNPKYWDTNTDIQYFMQEHGIEDSHGLQHHFNKRIHTILEKYGKTMVGWEEIMHPNLDTNIVVQSWKSQKALFEAVQNGSNAILSAKLYLDHKLPTEDHYKVDPFVLPGAVDIVPDSNHWKKFELVTETPAAEMEMSLVIFDKDKSNIFGYFNMMDNLTSFKGGTLNKAGEFEAPILSDIGELTFKAKITDNLIIGNVHFGLMKMKSEGVLTGGSEMIGTALPNIETIKPLTDRDKAQILGAEAAMWSEVVSFENIDSRIWPRTAAIAEKLWSPAKLTDDIEDMYRRLDFISDELSDRGSTHITYYPKMLMNLMGSDKIEVLKTFVDILEEAKYYNRHSLYMEDTNLYLPDLAINEVVDAARPESIEARNFNRSVNDFVENENENIKTEILDQLKIWSRNHQRLEVHISNSEKLEKIRNLSYQLSDVSGQLVGHLDTGYREGFSLDDKIISSLEEKIDYLERGEHGVIVAISPGLRSLLSILEDK